MGFEVVRGFLESGSPVDSGFRMPFTLVEQEANPVRGSA
jgi:hypothetical protein